mmetsp:Transcript_38709/g.120968  ORF Transcript_38709/g.120968 Transcript_38709/m.120968 type:complete len:244 (+) Transcript_38709:33-764(+)
MGLDWEAQLAEADAEGAGVPLQPATTGKARRVRLDVTGARRPAVRGWRRLTVATVAAVGVLAVLLVACAATLRPHGGAHTARERGGRLATEALQAERGGGETGGRAAVFPARDSPRNCTRSWGECTATRCCSDERQRCFMKNPKYAQCRTTCILGLNPDEAKTFYWSAWSCVKLDAVEEPPQERSCAVDGSENCSVSRCCKKNGHLCFQKDQFWAACNATCQEGVSSAMDPPEHRGPWTCEVL